MFPVHISCCTGNSSGAGDGFPRCLNLVLRSKDKRLGRKWGSSRPIPSSYTGLNLFQLKSLPLLCCSPVTSIVLIFLSLPTVLKGSLDSLYFIFLQSIFYLLLLETAHCKVISYPPIAETNDHLPVWFCTLALGCCSQLLRETVLRRLRWLPSSGSPPCLQLLLGLASVVSPGLETQLPPWLSSAFSFFPLRILFGWSCRPRVGHGCVRCCDLSHTLCGWLSEVSKQLKLPSSKEVSSCHGISTWPPLRCLARACACACVHAQSCPTLASPWTVARQAPLSMGSPGQNTGVGCHSLLQAVYMTCPK